jgi:hypothetical protein
MIRLLYILFGYAWDLIFQRGDSTVGVRVTVAIPDFAVSAQLVAFTVTVCWAAMEAGAVYKPV